jgi:hypothetical protein
LISFGGEYGFGADRGDVTRTHPGAPDVPVLVEQKSGDRPQNTSCVSVDAGLVTIEVYERTSLIERVFTKKALASLTEEFSDVLANLTEVAQTGLLPDAHQTAKDATLQVSDGPQEGIYVVSAEVNPRKAGYAELRIFSIADGQRMGSSDSKRFVGWCADERTFFPYSAQIFLYCDRAGRVETRFELWHVANDGTEQKMVEHVCKAIGWER